MNINLTIASASAASTARLRVPAYLAGSTRSAEPTIARTVQPTAKRIAWPSVGVMPVSMAAAATQHQDGPIADLGGHDVTDFTFSTRLGPPSCSPPV